MEKTVFFLEVLIILEKLNCEISKKNFGKLKKKEILEKQKNVSLEIVWMYKLQ